jgi:hypothetical protein
MASLKNPLLKYPEEGFLFCIRSVSRKGRREEKRRVRKGGISLGSLREIVLFQNAEIAMNAFLCALCVNLCDLCVNFLILYERKTKIQGRQHHH